jgi:hypothetical protein
VFGGIYHLDIVVPNSRSIAIAIEVHLAICWHVMTSAGVYWRMLTYADVCWQVDGPSHFLQISRYGAGRYLKFNVETRLKRRILKRLGWKVVSLPYTR